MTEEETSAFPENSVESQIDQASVVPPVRSPLAKRENVTQRNLIHVVFLAILLISGNYLAYQSFKSSAGSGDYGNASSADGIANQLNSVKQNPSYEGWLNLGMIYYNNHRYQDAIDAWKQGLQFNPSSDILHSNIGSAYGCMGKFQEDKAACEKALSINPNFTMAQNNLNYAQSELSKLNGTPPLSNNTNTGIDQSGGKNVNFDALVNQGLALYNNKDYTGAIAIWEKALRLNPNSVVALNDLGAAYGCMGRWREEVAVCEKALAIDPTFKLAIGNLNWAKSELKKQGVTQ